MKTLTLPSRAIATGLLAVGCVGLFGTAVAFAAAPTGQICAGLDSGKIDTTSDPMTVTITAPEGQLITGYCVKAGSANSGDGALYFDADNDERLPAASITITYTGMNGRDKAISHYSYSLTGGTSSSTTTTATTPPTTPPTTQSTTTSTTTTTTSSTTAPPSTTSPSSSSETTRTTAPPSKPSSASSASPLAPSTDVPTVSQRLQTMRLANTGSELPIGAGVAVALICLGGGMWALSHRTGQH